MAKGVGRSAVRVAIGAAIVGLVLVAGAELLRRRSEPEPTPTPLPLADDARAGNPEYLDAMSVVFDDVRIERGYQYIRGTVANNGGRRVIAWKVAIKLLDVDGAVIDTTSIASRETLGPGERKQWERMHREDKRIRSYRFVFEEVHTQ